MAKRGVMWLGTGSAPETMNDTITKDVLKRRHCDERAAAEFLGVSTGCLRDWRFARTGPVYAKFGRCVRYPLDELEKFAQQSRVQVTA